MEVSILLNGMGGQRSCVCLLLLASEVDGEHVCCVCVKSFDGTLCRYLKNKVPTLSFINSAQESIVQFCAFSVD